ncbi:serine/threonine-protein phosphatase|uniref:Stage II sporulation protein E (SpoIIE) n=1 Tax=Dendrosporobacter quercicolus TaxID=146817 RepID=A0A1G9KPZ7_9FIRM|nr:PP2C family protein-serine/threonine phosphatase [Dendrosporobacter quercicolus]NSL46471.1 serine/threonine-protein phosphatase [Dendrosporobacter quercicolus DSM 1736]SDL51772.1 Stage II sporulation protein E (SpoIIE) [Dendrosporobacter quercicolus]
MEIKIGMAKINKYAVSHSGDSVEVAERPQGGITAILADGQGSGRAARNTSSLVVNKAAALIADGARDGAVARAVHDYLYALKDGKVSSTLTLISADLDAGTVVISRNSNCPVIVKDAYGLTIYDEEVNSIGVHKRTKPLMYQVPLEAGMIFIAYTDGIQAAGRKKSKEIDFAKILAIIEENGAADVAFIADSILEYALKVDEYRPGDDMTVVVLSICESENPDKIRRMSVSFPC